jgi:hypothetical protein
VKCSLSTIRALAASRAVTPLVLLCFLLLYVGLAFFIDEPLTTLISLIRSTAPLALLLALIPLNCAFRLVEEGRRFMNLRRVMKEGARGKDVAGLFDESLTLSGNPSLTAIRGRLESSGYRTRLDGSSLAAWRGITLVPARLLFRAGLLCLFTGILLSTAMRHSRRGVVIEGEPFPLTNSGNERVTRITLADSHGLLLERTLAIEVAGDDGGRRVFDLYPPSRHHGYYVYPRYLGIAPLISFTAPDLPNGFESHVILMIYPPGREDSATIPGTDYRIVFSVAKPAAGDDPYRSGRMTINFRILKGDEPVSSGKLALGNTFIDNGYTLSIPEFRRVVATDLVRDHGLILVVSAAGLMVAALLFWVPVRLGNPRREMLFFAGESALVNACSRAEGGRGSHGGVFFEALDVLAAGNPDAPPPDNG